METAGRVSIDDGGIKEYIWVYSSFKEGERAVKAAQDRVRLLKLEIQYGVVFVAVPENYGMDLEELGEVSAFV